jgi:hypothetical protein
MSSQLQIAGVYMEIDITCEMEKRVVMMQTLWAFLCYLLGRTSSLTTGNLTPLCSSGDISEFIGI